MAKRPRYTISKDVAESLQLQGWELVETFYSQDYGTNIYHLETEEETDKNE